MRNDVTRDTAPPGDRPHGSPVHYMRADPTSTFDLDRYLIDSHLARPQSVVDDVPGRCSHALMALVGKDLAQAYRDLEMIAMMRPDMRAAWQTLHNVDLQLSGAPEWREALQTLNKEHSERAADRDRVAWDWARRIEATLTNGIIHSLGPFREQVAASNVRDARWKVAAEFAGASVLLLPSIWKGSSHWRGHTSGTPGDQLALERTLIDLGFDPARFDTAVKTAAVAVSDMILPQDRSAMSEPWPTTMIPPIDNATRVYRAGPHYDYAPTALS